MAEPTVLFGANFGSRTATATSRLLDVGGRVFNTFASLTSNFGGQFEIQGKFNSESTWHRVRYWVYDPNGLEITGPYLDPIVPPVSGVRHYYVIDPWRVLRVDKTQSRGTIDLDYFPQPLDSHFLSLVGSTPSNILTLEQSDPDDLHISAHLKLGLEDVGDLNRVPVSTELEAVLQDIHDLMEVPFATAVIEITGIGTGVAYADGDAFGTGITIPLPAHGVITEVEFLDLDDEGSGLELALFANPLAAVPVNNDPFAPTDADMASYRGHINVASSDFANWSVNRGGTSYIPDKQFVSVGGILVGYWIAKGTPNIAASNIPRFRLRGRTTVKEWSVS